MARIRSIHPGIYTDEAWASVSLPARWFAMGLCTEADDNGTFEWKPLTLKMRIFPADAVDVPELLAELVAAGIVMPFQAEGKAFGSIKNFCKFQRPRKPKAWFPSTPESRSFSAVGAEETSDDQDEPAPVPQKSVLTHPETTPVPSKSEKSPQMEDGGGRREEKISDANASSVAAGDGEGGFEDLWKAYPHVRGRSSKPNALKAWLTVPADVRPLLARAAQRYASGGTIPPGGAPALGKWLDEERWGDWIAEDAKPPAAEWCGPTDVREAFSGTLGDGWCRAYLDPCAWQDVPERALIPHTDYAGRKLVSDGKAILAKLGLEVQKRAA
jgi:hypothetical protein